MRLAAMLLLTVSAWAQDNPTTDAAIISALKAAGGYAAMANAVTPGSGITIVAWTCIQLMPAATPWVANKMWNMTPPQLVIAPSGDVYKVTKWLGPGKTSGANPPIWNRAAPVVDGGFQLTYLYASGWQFFCAQAVAP